MPKTDKHYYYVKWVDVCRLSHTDNPIQACKDAYGMVSDNMYVYDFGKRSPKYLGAEKMRTVHTSMDGWVKMGGNAQK